MRRMEATPGGGANGALKIVIAYETAAIAVRAKEMTEFIAADLQIECDSWPMILLSIRELSRQAATAAAQADLVIIAARGDGHLPAEVRNWIEDWLPRRKQGPSALVVLFDAEAHPPDGSHPPDCAYLREVARRGSMDFFCNASEWVLHPGAPDCHLDVPLLRNEDRANLLGEPARAEYGLNG